MSGVSSLSCFAIMVAMSAAIVLLRRRRDARIRAEEESYWRTAPPMLTEIYLPPRAFRPRPPQLAPGDVLVRLMPGAATPSLPAPSATKVVAEMYRELERSLAESRQTVGSAS